MFIIYTHIYMLNIESFYFLSPNSALKPSRLLRLDIQSPAPLTTHQIPVLCPSFSGPTKMLSPGPMTPLRNPSIESSAFWPRDWSEMRTSILVEGENERPKRKRSGADWRQQCAWNRGMYHWAATRKWVGGTAGRRADHDSVRDSARDKLAIGIDIKVRKMRVSSAMNANVVHGMGNRDQLLISFRSMHAPVVVGLTAEPCAINNFGLRRVHQMERLFALSNIKGQRKAQRAKWETQNRRDLAMWVKRCSM